MNETVTPLAAGPPIFSQFSPIAGQLMSVNQANSLSNGKTVIFADLVGMSAWPATISAFTKLGSMLVTPTSTMGLTPPAPVTFPLSGEGTASLPLYAVS